MRPKEYEGYKGYSVNEKVAYEEFMGLGFPYR